MKQPLSPIAHIAALWRYPVKSMGGEPVEQLQVLQDGIEHDRRYAFLSSGAPVGKPRLTSRERAAMLQYVAAAGANGIEITIPQGRRFHVNDPELLEILHQHLPQRNRLTLDHEPAGPPFTDVRPISIVSVQTLAAIRQTFGQYVDPRRFRANLVLDFGPASTVELTGGAPDAFPEESLAGQTLQIGTGCRLRVLERIPRCRVVTLDPDTTEADPLLMKHLDRRHDGRVGVYAAVVIPGPVRVGDDVSVASA